MPDNEFTEISDESRAKLWPEPESRPDKAWEHRLCRLIVTNRAAHLGGTYRCPEIDKGKDRITDA